MDYRSPAQSANASSSGTPMRTTPVGSTADDHGAEPTMEADIRHFLEELQDAGRRLRQEKNRPVNRRNADFMENELKRCRKMLADVDQLFREWTVYLAGEPLQRQKKRFSFEKLHAALGQEKRAISRLAVDVQDSIAECRRANSATPPPRNQRGGPDVELGSPSGGTRGMQDLEVGESEILLGVRQETAQIESAAMLQSRIARENEQGIQNVQSGIHEINTIFKDIAGLVVQQGQTVQTIENNTMNSLNDTVAGRQQLQKAHDRAASSRKNACIVLTLAIGVLCLLWWLGSKPSPAVQPDVPASGASAGRPGGQYAQTMAASDSPSHSSPHGGDV